MLVSACLIARNEERFIARCLDSIRDACDEICIVDTGSTDRTQEIARAAGANLLRFTGCNGRDGKIADFSLARNKSLELARGTWVLWIDADEVLEHASVRNIRMHASRNAAAGVRVCLRNNRTRWPVVRLFRRAAENRFHGIVHEWIAVAGSISTDMRIVIRNLPDKRGKESAIMRDLRLCTRALAADRNDARMLFYMARALQKTGDHSGAIGYYYRFLEVEKHFKAGRHLATHSIAVCHLLSGRWGEAAAVARRAVAIDPCLADSHCVLGDAYLALSMFAQAESSYRRAIQCGPPRADYPLFVDTSFHRRYPRQRLDLLSAR